MSLEKEEIARYARHLVLPEVGGPGQARLKAARVLVVGAGGLGAPVIQYLAAAGVGTLGIADDDRVELSNLQRQVIHATADVGRAKTESAADAVAAINPHVAVVRDDRRLDADTVEEAIRGYDVVAEGSDNFGTRLAVADACERLRVPLVTAAVGRFDGSLTTLMPWRTDPNGRPYPTFRCLFPEAPQGVPDCATAGILGAVPGVLGSLQAIEVLKVLLGTGTPLLGRLLLVDCLDMRFETLAYARAPERT
jgi:adenylyltransferase/sulfurtransferase